MRQVIERKFPGVAVRFEEQTNSTMELAKELLSGSEQPSGLIGIGAAREQLRGRGRQGRSWISKPGDGVYVSVAWRYESVPSELGLLPLCVGVQLLREFNEFNLPLQLKWPNDLVVLGKKLGGVLVESSTIGERTEVVVGVGVNLRGSMGVSFSELGAPVSYEDLLLRTIQAQVNAFCETPMSRILPEYRQACLLLGREVEFLDGSVAIASDIAEDGALLLDSGRRVYSGDVHIVGYER
jgi:BirA family transcriptional regulator, biotin operon repressor / biotin---[acetyl-CoA-carboxylase] ligase